MLACIFWLLFSLSCLLEATLKKKKNEKVPSLIFLTETKNVVKIISAIKSMMNNPEFLLI